jgi:glycosyltransferase involved in cell wall biosynthesis
VENNLRVAFITAGNAKFEDYKKGVLLGLEYQTFGLAKALKRLGYEPLILRNWHNNLEEEIDGVKILNIPSLNFHDWNIKGIFTKTMFSKNCKKIIGSLKIDVLNLTDKFTALHVLDFNIPKVYITHTPPYDLTVSLKRGQNVKRDILWHIKRPLNISVEAKVFKKCNAIVALNSTISKFLYMKGFNSTIIPSGIEYEEYNKVYLDNSNDLPYVLFGGRLSPEKNVNVLIEAFARIDKKIRDSIKLLIIGSGEMENFLKRKAKKEGLTSKDILFYPFLPSFLFRKILAKSRIFVLPSLYEASPVTILEAMALRKPVVASRILGVNDIITHGYNGFLFNPDNSDELKRYLEILLVDEDFRKKMGERGSITVRNNYDFKVIAAKYIKLYESMNVSKEL